MIALIAILAAAAIAVLAAMAVIAVGHQTEERPGYIDLTGAVRRPGRRARAHAPAQQKFEQLHPGRVIDWASDPGDADVRLLEEVRAGREVFRAPSGATVIASPGTLREIPDGYEQLTENELAYRVATQQQPRGGEAA